MEAQSSPGSKWLLIAGGVVLLLAVFIAAQMIGGATSDESFHVRGIREQVGFAVQVLHGNFAVNFTDLVGDSEFYGIAPVLPTYIVLELGKLVAPGSSLFELQRWAIHATAYFYGMGTVGLVYLLLRREVSTPRLAAAVAVLFGAYPLWLGFSFFDYKDLSIAFFVTLAVVAVAGALREKRAVWAWLLVVATLGAADSKLAALGLILAPWLFFLWSFGRARPFLTVTAGIVAALAIYATTPPMWVQPYTFVTQGIEYMAHHGWSGCTLTNGRCTGTHAPDWSAWRYALTWFLAQMPITVVLGLLPALAVALLGSITRKMLAAALLLPAVVIAAQNSTLYDGFRQVLFLVPIALVLVALLADWLISRWRPLAAPIAALALGMFGLAMIDDLKLFPYDYTYFNLVARQWADASWFENDFWGFSMREAVRQATPLMSPQTPVLRAMGGPPIDPFLPRGTKMIEWNNTASLTSGARYVGIVETRYPVGRGANCRDVSTVARALAFTPVVMTYEWVQDCKVP